MKIVLKVLDVIAVIYGLMGVVTAVIAFMNGGEAAAQVAAFFGATGAAAITCVYVLEFNLSTVLRKDSQLFARIGLSTLLLGSSMMFMAPDERFYRWGIFALCVGIACILGVLIDWGHERLMQTRAVGS